MIKNQIHSDLYGDLTKLKDKLNCVKIKLNFEKDNNWDIWMHEDEDMFYKNKRFIIKELKSQIKELETEIYKVKHAIKISQKNYNKKDEPLDKEFTSDNGLLTLTRRDSIYGYEVMEYCEDVASKKQRELFELANESILMLDEDGYIQFEKSISLNKTTYPEYDWIDGIQLVDDSIVVWLSTENSEDIFSSDIELFDEHTIDEMKSALQHTIKHLLKKS